LAGEHPKEVSKTRRNIPLIASILLISIIAWGDTPRPPHTLAPGEMLFEFNDTAVQHDMGCGGTGKCLVAELVEVVSDSGVFIGTAREEVYEIIGHGRATVGAGCYR
jgi:hypothetical protein